MYDLSGNESIPISINATKSADYSADSFTPIGNISLKIILDVLRDLDPASVPEDRLATLLVSLQTPISTVTGLAGYIPPAISTEAPPVTEPIPTEAPPQSIPDTPIPPTVIIPPPPQPAPPKPKKPPKDPPPPPKPIQLNIIMPSTDGTNITAMMIRPLKQKPGIRM